ncbi:MAG TPA: hypothetical protein PLE48_07045 [Thiobacillus sp.]|nr:MAG: hypothetical protein B7Y50_11085 [Hydrogenophilales bacterium 28-61-11]OYZ57162.1 MAG: hypothetical protein B7Y21_08580 [Hydrogenophilales bacterium 16-61-112]OZA51094.1 MAG: hypothetical protein B7X81_00135 [Hydrogenophilales bacterium 17-61-76]HQT30862.1 hypothetical protein [Thiobacillus sp.]HQT70162.1 hypothetical protein [Thiobacillus sp.]
MRAMKALTLVLAFSATLAALAGCDKQEGPAEEAGKEVDQASEQVGQSLEKAGENIQDAANGNK